MHKMMIKYNKILSITKDIYAFFSSYHYTNTKILLLIAVLASPKSQPPFAFKKLNGDADVLPFYLNFFTNLQPSKANS